MLFDIKESGGLNYKSNTFACFQDTLENMFRITSVGKLNFLKGIVKSLRFFGSNFTLDRQKLMKMLFVLTSQSSVIEFSN